ncbi:Peptidoglycan O-acetyltransferase [compost metagenome]
MAIAGLWHGGDSWNYLLWGSAHGIALCVDRLWSRSSLPSVPPLLSHTLTLLFVFLAWTLFRAPDFHSAVTMYAGQFGLQGFALGDALAVTLRPVHGIAALLGVLYIVAPVLQGRFEHRYVGHALFAPMLGFLLAFALVASRESVPFLYFQF